MRVNSVGAVRARLERSRSSKSCDRYQFLPQLWVVRLVLAVGLVAGAAAQDGSSPQTASPPVAPQRPAEVPLNAPSAPASNTDSASSQPDQAEAGGFVFRKEVEEVALRAI